MAEDRAPPILPSVADVIGAGKARIVAVRPSAKKHINRGRWAIPVTAWQGQFLKARARLAAEVKAAFLRSSTGDALTFLAASNYDTPRSTTGATAAMGSLTLTREPQHYLPSKAIVVTAADATSLATLTTLLTNIRTMFNAHIASEYDAGTGLGAHVNATTSTMGAVSVGTMGAIVATLSDFKTKANLHFTNPDPALIVLGNPIAHIYADPVNRVTAPNAFASDAGTAFGSQTTASQQSALAEANAIKKALNAHMLRRSTAGVIRSGTRVRVAANPAAVPPIGGGEYEVVRNTYAGVGTISLVAPVQAVTLGSGANLPIMSPAASLELSLAGSLYDVTEPVRWGPSGLSAAGGTNGQSDALLRQAAAATWQGIYGPTRHALAAGAFQYPGLARCPILRDTTNGASVVYALDESWAQSPDWQAGLEQALKETWLGVGCKLSRGTVTNRVVRVALTVVLREQNDLADVDAIADALEATVKAYFDDRSDFYVFRTRALRAVCSRAHRKILKCTSATVLDVDGTPIAEPDIPAPGDVLTHWLFAGAPDVTFDVAV